MNETVSPMSVNASPTNVKKSPTNVNVKQMAVKPVTIPVLRRSTLQLPVVTFVMLPVQPEPLPPGHD